ncbi:hypothetical protein GQ53DRAFT_747611 [Thozetella sp. PMI_491]|nr:hypothetical protein GQ53DRAFT_747611 [Thozetella sp. PMI_491]
MDDPAPSRYATPPARLTDEDATLVRIRPGQPWSREYVTRNLKNYPYWGARLLELEAVARGRGRSTFNEWSDEQQDKKVWWITLLAFVLSIIALILTGLSTGWAKNSLDAANQANVYASIASVGGDEAANLTSSFLSSLGCCCGSCQQGIPTVAENATTTSTMSLRTTRVVTVTATTLVTVTVTTILDVTLASV